MRTEAQGTWKESGGDSRPWRRDPARHRVLVGGTQKERAVVSSLFSYGYQAAYWLCQNITEGWALAQNLNTCGDLLKQKVDLPK